MQPNNKASNLANYRTKRDKSLKQSYCTGPISQAWDLRIRTVIMKNHMLRTLCQTFSPIQRLTNPQSSIYRDCTVSLNAFTFY